MNTISTMANTPTKVTESETASKDNVTIDKKQSPECSAASYQVSMEEQKFVEPIPLKSPQATYRPVYSFPTAAVPKTTNKTAGYTPWVDLKKRALDFDGEKSTTKKVKVVRNTKKETIQSHNCMSNLHSLFYEILPDGVVCAYPARGKPTGPPGYAAPAFRLLGDYSSGIFDQESERIAKLMNVTTILPFLDNTTGESKKISWKKTFLEVRAFVLVNEAVSDNTKLNVDKWCKQIVRVLNSELSLTLKLHLVGMQLTMMSNQC